MGCTMKKQISSQDMNNIIQECQKIFIPDALERLQLMIESLDKYKNNVYTWDETCKIAYDHAHSLKGVALSIQFEEIHSITDRLTVSLKDTKQLIDLETLTMEVNKLESAIERAKNSLNI